MEQTGARRRTASALLGVPLALFLIVLLGACTDDGDLVAPSEQSSTTTEAATETSVTAPTTTEEPVAETTTTTVDDVEAPDDATATVDAGRVHDGVLAFGRLTPETGALSYLSPPQVAATELAIIDINAAGGVGDVPVVMVSGDSGDAGTETAQRSVSRLLGLNVDVVLGASSSAISKEIFSDVIDAGVIQFSPANTSPWFTSAADRGLYFRTAPSDLLQGQVLAELVAEDGNATAAIIYRDEEYGEGLAEAFTTNFRELGGELVDGGLITYDVAAEEFGDVVDAAVAAEPDAVILIGFAESARILTLMHEAGIGPTSDSTMVYGVDGNTPGMGLLVEDPAILSGFQGTEPSVDLTTIQGFIDRMQEWSDEYTLDLQGNYSYGPESYDAMIISALAAEIVGSDDPVAIAGVINDVTRTGTKCTTFATCKELVLAGDDIDYDGVGGPYEFRDPGEPAAASYRIATYDGDADINEDLSRYVFASTS